MSPSNTHEGDFPGRVALCEWCGFFVQNLQAEGAMTFCPRCHNQSLISECTNCNAPICVPPQRYCLKCGKRLTTMEVQETPLGYQHVTIPEPEPEQRKELESKGYHWHDVVTGRAPGGPENRIPAPPGWDKDEWDKMMLKAREQEGLLLRYITAADLKVIKPRRNAFGEALRRILEKLPDTRQCPKCRILYVGEHCPYCHDEEPEPKGT